MTWLLNTSATLRRAIALAVLVMVIAVMALAIMAASAHFIQAHQTIEDKRRTLGRLQAVRAQLPRAIEAMATRASDESGFLKGETEAVIRARMQQQFQSIADAQRVNVMSVGKAPDFIKEEVNYAGLQANIAGTHENLHRLLLALEIARPMLFVTYLTVRSPDALANRTPTRDPILTAQLRVYGALSPDDADPGEAAQ